MSHVYLFGLSHGKVILPIKICRQYANILKHLFRILLSQTKMVFDII